MTGLLTYRTEISNDRLTDLLKRNLLWTYVRRQIYLAYLVTAGEKWTNKQTYTIRDNVKLVYGQTQTLRRTLQMPTDLITDKPTDKLSYRCQLKMCTIFSSIINVASASCIYWMQLKCTIICWHSHIHIHTMFI